MPTSLTLDQHLAGIGDAVRRFARHAEEAGLDVGVPTCPDWTVRRLIGHQGAVHRWAAASLRGAELEQAPVAKAGRSHAHPVEWLRDGAIELVRTLVAAGEETPEAPAPSTATPFLLDAPPARRFWARRQCHETTVHAVDALAAALGRRPRAEETGVTRDIAVDGVDELLLGFVPRPRCRLRAAGETVGLAIHVLDGDHSYAVEVGDGPPVVTRHEGATAAPGDRVAAASAVALYLALWHRTDLDSAIWPLWHDAGVL